MAKQSSNKFLQLSGADTSKRGKSRSSKAKSSRQTKKRAVGKSLTQKGKTKSRSKTNVSDRGKNVRAKVTKGAKDQVAKEVQKGDETSLIGPDDYLHLFKGAPKSSTKMKIRKAKNDANSSMAIPSDAPTALLAPEDYDHMYTAVPKCQKVESDKARKTSSKKKTKKKKPQEVPEVPDDAPTVLKEIVAKERAGQPVNFEDESAEEQQNGCCRII